MECVESGDWPALCGDRDDAALSEFDRRDLRDCEDYAVALGYQGLTVHAINPVDGSGAAELACACRFGEAWMTWVFMRTGAVIVAWSTLTGWQAGTFVSMAEAVRCVLLCDPTQEALPDHCA